MDDAHDVTHLLGELREGSARAADALLPLVYDELRRLAAHRLAAEPAGLTLEATAIVHEAYLRLVDQRRATIRDRDHFFALAAQAIRRVLVDHARGRRRLRRSAGDRGAALDSEQVGAQEGAATIDLIALDEALGLLANEHPEKARLVELRYFGGMTAGQSAAFLGTTERTAERWWQFARAWLFDRLAGGIDGQVRDG